MKFTTVAAAAGFTSLASAQGYTSNPNGTFSCAIPNGTYCAGANIILRCTNGVGQPGNCDDNLSGEPPVGVLDALCFDCGANSGRAACSKNGIVYPSSGSGLGSATFSSNDTSVCSTSTAPYSNGTNPGGPVVNATSTGSGSASSTGSSGSGSGSGSSSSSSPVPYTGAGTSVQMMSAGAVAGFGVLFAAFGML